MKFADDTLDWSFADVKIRQGYILERGQGPQLILWALLRRAVSLVGEIGAKGPSNSTETSGKHTRIITENTVISCMLYKQPEPYTSPLKDILMRNPDAFMNANLREMIRLLKSIIFKQNWQTNESYMTSVK